METQNIKKIAINILIMITVLNLRPGKSQAIDKPEISFKIINYRKVYKITDTIDLLIENVSAKSLYYVIGIEVYDDDNLWIQILPDIRNDPTKDLPGKYEILSSHKRKIMKFIGFKKTIKQQKGHGITKRTRFYLYYQALNSPVGENRKKLVSGEYFKTW